jgi:hypothetical protein
MNPVLGAQRAMFTIRSRRRIIQIRKTLNISALVSRSAVNRRATVITTVTLDDDFAGSLT